MKVQDIVNLIDAFAPFDTQADFDHSGLQVGDAAADVTGVVVAVDLSEAVIDEAKASGCNVIVTHHPAIWQPLEAVVEDDYTQRMVRRLVREDMHYIAAHTNVDKCVGGNSERLVRVLGGTPVGRLPEDDYFVTFNMAPTSLADLLAKVRWVLGDDTAFAIGKNDLLTRGALCTGAGASDQSIAACCRAGYVCLTSEVKHHLLRYAYENGGHLVVFGHYASERIFVDIIMELLQGAAVRAVASCQDNPCIIG